jgi:predicted nucleic acid-binding protein
MNVYCDTSFFVRQLVPGPDFTEAIQIARDLVGRFGTIPISDLTRFEVIQALRFEAWRNRNDRKQGLPVQTAETALNLFLAEISTSFRLTPLDFGKVLENAESLSRSTPHKGWRTLDVIHVATAISLQAMQFFSFDQQQNQLAREQQMITPLARG